MNPTDTVAAQVEALREREARLRELLLAPPPPAAGPPAPERNGAARARDKQEAYRRTIARVRAVVGAVVPAGATVAVVSRGDEELVRFPERVGWHFPRTASGTYAGHHPADDSDTVALLEEVRGRGARFLVFPDTAFWWLDHYAGFQAHLAGQYRRLYADGFCQVYGLDEQPGAGVATRLAALAGEVATLREQLGRAAEEIRAARAAAASAYKTVVAQVHRAVVDAVPAGSVVAVVSKGDDDLLALGGCRGRHFPQTPSGVYAGHHPLDGAAAISHLEQLRAQGAGYLVFPSTAFWWLAHYAEFCRHLDEHYRRTRSDAGCIIFDLTAGRPGPLRRLARLLVPSRLHSRPAHGPA